jgi:hypothetical protein
VDEDAWSDIGRFRSSGKRFLGASVEGASQDETEEQEVSHLGGNKGKKYANRLWNTFAE